MGKHEIDSYIASIRLPDDNQPLKPEIDDLPF
ncbi:hypothetical protein J2S17_002254 [Cytobacillus purgationiresistens]|uniref:Uncharacterized protein n=1 Tax=Cytobacillus purgationiresistens TaxID=863449 RepID=A0ABU0AHM0_9BACI|nr:hypothetical protein [Cytobacillus purgationiresistens]